jgi:transcriptional regulator of acetoin/glycerol metabolism
MADGELLTEKDLSLVPQPQNSGADDWGRLSLDEAEKRLIVMSLDKNNGSAIAAAKELGVSRSAFYRRLEKYGL